LRILYDLKVKPRPRALRARFNSTFSKTSNAISASKLAKLAHAWLCPEVDRTVTLLALRRHVVRPRSWPFPVVIILFKASSNDHERASRIRGDRSGQDPRLRRDAKHQLAEASNRPDDEMCSPRHDLILSNKRQAHLHFRVAAFGTVSASERAYIHFPSRLREFISSFHNFFATSTLALGDPLSEFVQSIFQIGHFRSNRRSCLSYRIGQGLHPPLRRPALVDTKAGMTNTRDAPASPHDPVRRIDQKWAGEPQDREET